VGDGVRVARVWRAVLGVEHTVIEGVELEQAGTGEVLVARVRPLAILGPALPHPRVRQLAKTSRNSCP
jgi:hypothetical protein